MGRADQDRVRALLTEAVTVLCRNGLPYKSSLCVQGLLGITMDENEIFLVDIKETVTNSFQPDDIVEELSGSSGGEEQDISHSHSARRRKRKRRHHRQRDVSGNNRHSFDGDDTEPRIKRDPSEFKRDSTDYVDDSRVRSSDRTIDLVPEDQIIKVEEDDPCENVKSEMSSLSYSCSRLQQQSSYATDESRSLDQEPGCSTWDTSASQLPIPGDQQYFSNQGHSVGGPPVSSADQQSYGHGRHLQGGQSSFFSSSHMGDSPQDIYGAYSGADVVPSPDEINVVDPMTGMIRPGLVDPDTAAKLNMVELLPGSGVYVYSDLLERALQDAVDKPELEGRLSRDGKKLVRRITTIFWKFQELAGTTIAEVPKAGRKSLNPRIVNAVIDFCLLRSNTTKTELKQAIYRKITSSTNVFKGYLVSDKYGKCLYRL